MTVVAIIPALDEERAIGGVVAGLPAGVLDEVIVVDNGSRDGTADAARRAGARVVAETQRGYGAAMMAGVAAAPAASVYVFIDGDGSDVTDRLGALVGLVREGRAQIALGVRAGAVEPGAMPWHQRLGNRLVAWIIARSSGRALRDLPSLKVIDAAAYRSLALRERRHGWTAELLTKAAMRRLVVTEVATGYRRRVGVSKVSGSATGSVLAAYGIIAAVVRAWRSERGGGGAKGGG